MNPPKNRLSGSGGRQNRLPKRQSSAKHRKSPKTFVLCLPRMLLRGRVLRGENLLSFPLRQQVEEHLGRLALQQPFGYVGDTQQDVLVPGPPDGLEADWQPV
jgi:hypothetical protein